MDTKQLQLEKTPIEGLFVIRLVVHEDNRGSFKENYQKQKMEALGLPSFEIVQNNISFNKDVGVARGLHAEPWEKFISVASGRVFGAWADLRPGPGFGSTFSIEITPGVAVFVPRGVANGYQTLEADSTYTYLVNEHWSPEAKYTFVNLQDPELAIKWPNTIEDNLLSEKDKKHPLLSEVRKNLE